MATQNSINLKVTNNADGYDIAGGTTARKLAISGGDIAVVGSGAAVITFPGSTSTLATLGANTFTGTQALGANNLTLTGDIASTGSRVNKGWFTDLQVSNAIAGSITGNAATVSTIAGLAPDTATTQVTQGAITSLGTLTGLTLSGTIELGHATENTLSGASGVLSIEGVAIPTISSTNTFTNKRITQRITTIASNGTPTVNTDNTDLVTITALAVNITNMTTNLTGTETNGQKLIYRILDNGTPRTISWGTSFQDAGVALPTTTTTSKLLTVGFIYNTVTSKFGCVAVADES